MVKAKEFLTHLCEECDYRFFTGLPNRRLKPLYNNMSSDFMHYIPAVNEKVAYGLARGTETGGTKSVVIVDILEFDRLEYYLKYDNCKLLFLKGVDKHMAECFIRDKSFKSRSVVMTDDYKKDLIKLFKKMEKRSSYGILFIEEGLIQ